jgi:cytochrome c oxidase subunit 2
MKRDLVIVGALWLVLTVVGEALAVLGDIYPVARSDKGEEIEHAFRILVIAAVPVFTMVVAVLLYSVLRHRTAGPPEGDGPALHGRGTVPVAWFAVTTGLTLLLIVYPGLTSLYKVVGYEDNPDLIVEVVGVQWTWLVSYPQYDATAAGELVLPVDRTVRFDITSLDVLHSFWVPAFLMKIDAVPGRTTNISLRPTKTGSFQTDPLLRVQCAELCGLAHAQMRIPVRVVSDQEFEEWVQEHIEAARGAPPGELGTPSGAEEVAIVGRDILFDIDEIVVEADTTVVIIFDNQDAAIPHNWALYDTEEAANSGVAPIAGSPIEPGPLVQEIVFEAPEQGSYFFRCDVHPTTMTGELIVE